jgi:hypothetical protein
MEEEMKKTTERNNEQNNEETEGNAIKQLTDEV